MKRYILIISVAIIAASCKKEATTYTVKEEILNEAVYASGEIMPVEYDFPSAGTTDRVLKILVKEGDSVKQGDVLVVLGTPSDNTQLDLLINQVALARQNASKNSAGFHELQNKIRLAGQKYKQDSLNAERYKNLAEDKAVSQKDAEQALLQAMGSLTEYNNLQQQYEAFENELSAKLLNAKQQLVQHRQSREGKVLTSRINGEVYNIYLEEGELAETDEPILMVGSANKFKLELLVDERDINKVALGQKVYFETDAFAEKQFGAEVTKIVPVLQKENRSFKVEARVLDNASFYPQSSVEANIMIREKVKAPVIPAEYLLDGDSVNLQRDEQEEKIKITAGVRNGNWIEVKGGLKAGDVITQRN